MRKYLIYSTLTIIGLIVIFVIYLSIYGIKTERFNNLIIDKIKSIDPKIKLDIKDVFLKLDLKKRSIKIYTENSKLNFENKYINFSKIDLNLDFLKYLKKENSIKLLIF